MSRPAWLLLLLALILRLAVAWWAQGLDLVLDELDYVKRARFIIENGHLPDAFRPPVYPAFVAAVFALFGEHLDAVRFVAVLGTLTGAGLYRWLQGHAGERGALLALALFTVYPTFVGFVHMLWSETVYLFLLTGFLILAFPAGGRSTTMRTAAARVAYGLAALTRSLLFPFLVVAAVVVGRAQRTWRAGLVLAAVALACAVPWAVHNQVVTGSPTVLEIANGYNLWKGNTPLVHPMAVEGPRFPGPLISIPMFPYEGSLEALEALCGERQGRPPTSLHFAETNACVRDLAIEHIVANPAAFLARGVVKLGYTLHPSSQVTRHLWLGYYGSVPLVLGHGLIALTAVSYIVVAGAGLIGWLRMPRGSLRLMLASLVLYQIFVVFVVFVTFGHSRFRLPVMLVAVICTAWLPRRR